MIHFDIAINERPISNVLIETARRAIHNAVSPFRFSPRREVNRLLNRDLPPERRIEMRSVWPLFFVPFLLIMQLFGPSAIWTALVVSLVLLYGVGYAWVRKQVLGIYFERRREGALLVVGDALQERFMVHNQSPLPLNWLEFADSSRLPGYNPRQVVSCGAGSIYQWRAQAHCSQRGVFRLGPHTLRTGDPFGLFLLEITGTYSESLVVYPRVAHIPPVDLPRGNLSGRDRRRRAYSGTERAPVVRAYRPGDSLRHVHWPISARQGELMVTDQETEPSGDLWIVLDVNKRAQTGKAKTSTLETGIILAASVAAELLGGGERRSVGLLTAPAAGALERMSADEEDAAERVSFDLDAALAAAGDGAGRGEDDLWEASASHLVDVPPLPGKGQVWRILAALAPVQVGDLTLSQLLQRSRGLFKAGQTVLVITPEIGDGVAEWAAELLHLRRGGVAASVLAVTRADDGAAATGEEIDGREERPPPAATSPIFTPGLPASMPAPFLHSSHDDGQARMVEILTRYEIPKQFMQAGTRLTPALTYRRTRTVLRTTPTGGVVTYEIEEDVG